MRFSVLGFAARILRRLACRMRGGHRMETMFPGAGWSAKRCVRCGEMDGWAGAEELLAVGRIASVEDFAAVDQGRATADQASRVARAEAAADWPFSQAVIAAIRDGGLR